MRGRRRMRLVDQHFAAMQCRDVCRKGAVTFKDRSRGKARIPNFRARSTMQCHDGGDGAGAEFAVLYDSEMFQMEMEEVGNLAMNRNGTLTLPSRLEAHHPPLILRKTVYLG